MGTDVPLSLNTLRLFEAAASFQGPTQEHGQGQSSLPRLDLPELQKKNLMEATGETFLSGSSHSLQSKASDLGHHRVNPNIPKTDLSLPDP